MRNLFLGEEVERRKKEEAGASGWEKALRVDVRKERLREWPSHSTTVRLDGETGEDEGPTASLALPPAALVCALTLASAA